MSPLFLMPNTSAIFPGIDILRIPSHGRVYGSVSSARKTHTCNWGLTELSSLGTKKRKPDSELPRVTLNKSPSVMPGHQLWLKITAVDFS